MKQQSATKKQSWAGTLVYLAVTAVHGWYLHGFVPIEGVIFLTFFGGILLYFGLKKAILALFASPLNVWGHIGGLILLGLGALTLMPGWPADWLLKAPLGWPVLENRSERLEDALYEENLALAQKIARVGLGQPEPRDTFGNPIIDDAKDPETLKMLIESGLNPDARDEGGTTLLMRTYDENVATILLAGGADPNARDENGRTPLMYVRDANLKMMEVLLENGAEANGVDDYGRTVADWIGTHPDMESLLASYAPGGIQRSEDIDFLSHARTEWLDQTNVPPASQLSPSEISVDPGNMTYGDQAVVNIRLTNETATDRVLRVEANLNSEALFIASSHEGKIINPYQPQLVQEIGWPLLSLPARSSGVLTLEILARDDWDAGDLTVDVWGRNALTYAEEETIFLNHVQPLTETVDFESSLLYSLLGALAIPLPIVLWVVARRFLGKDHPITRGGGRLLAGMFSLLCFLGAYSLTKDMLLPYFHYQDMEAEILDRRYYLETVNTSSSSGSRSTSTVISMPIVAARFQTPSGEIISSGPASDHFFRETQLGATVPGWYDPDNPHTFTVERSISVLTIIGIGFMGMLSLGLTWVALRRKKEVEPSS